MQPRPAATTLLLRDTPLGVEVLLQERTGRAVFVPGAHVFPGGAVDPDDASAELAAVCDDPEVADRPARVAAVREMFEEAGVLLATEPGADGVPDPTPVPPDRLAEHRRALLAGERGLVSVCRTEGLRLAVGQLRAVGRWVTPPGDTRRYDTRFFAVAAPLGQEASHDDGEMVASTWLRPAAALAAAERRELWLVEPTVHSLELISPFDSVGALLAALDGVADDDASWDETDDDRLMAEGGPARVPRLTPPQAGSAA